MKNSIVIALMFFCLNLVSFGQRTCGVVVLKIVGIMKPFNVFQYKLM